MSAHPLDPVAREVLRAYSSVPPAARLHALGSSGGFSGARLWRVESALGDLCLKAWPPRSTDAGRLGWIHVLMTLARTAGLRVVPALLTASHGSTWVQHAGLLWDLTTWMPGQADFCHVRSISKVEAASAAVAQIHRAWANVAPAVGPCPGVQRRLEKARYWLEVIQSGWRPPLTGNAQLRPLVERAYALLRARIGEVPQQLGPWLERPVPLQPCICDIWHDHVLYDGERVTGIIDYGGTKMDHVAVDLARLLGSMVGDDPSLYAAGLQAYKRLSALSLEEEALARILDETGTLIGMGNWVKWLCRDGYSFPDEDGVARRLEVLVRRLECMER
jgi:homoserine kinase type II